MSASEPNHEQQLATEYTFRHPRAQDAEAIYVLGNQCFDWPYEQIFWARHVVDSYLANSSHLCFVAERGERVVAFVLALTKDRTGYVGWVAVAPEERGKRLFAALADRCLARLDAEDIDFVLTIVRSELVRPCRRYRFEIAEQNKVVLIRHPQPVSPGTLPAQDR